MLQLQKGTFFGLHNQVIQLDGILLTDTEYTLDYVDWHYHKNPYFTFILSGNVLEGNRREKYECVTGTLLYHQWEDPHYNIKRPVYTRGFHIELEDHFFKTHRLDARITEGSVQLNDPVIRAAFYQLYAETKIHDPVAPVAVEDLLLRVFGVMASANITSSVRQPAWVSKVRQILHELPSNQLSYTLLAAVAGVHPVHLSREFPKYFHTSVGDYLRKMRLEKALILLAKTEFSATEITYDCGFADQSHFIRSFSGMMGMTPVQYRKIIGTR
jgi:AraC family transcriptional regulator